MFGIFRREEDGELQEPKRERWQDAPRAPTRAARRMTVFYGKSGVGKTTLMASMYAAALQRGISGTWIDPTTNNGYLVHEGTPAHHRAIVSTPDGWLAHVRRAARAQKRYNIVVMPEGPIDPLWLMVMRAGNALLAIDEVDTYAHASKKIEFLPIGTLLTQGRNSRISMMGTVRIPPELHGKWKSVADYTYALRQEDPSYAADIAERALKGAHPHVARWLLQLPPFHYLRFDHVRHRLTWGKVPPFRIS